MSSLIFFIIKKYRKPSVENLNERELHVNVDQHSGEGFIAQLHVNIDQHSGEGFITDLHVNIDQHSGEGLYHRASR